MLLVLLGPSLVGSSGVALFLNDTCRVIERPTSYETFLPRGSLNIKNQAISWKFLPTVHPKDITWFNIRPRNRQKSFDLSWNHQIFNLLVVNLWCHLSLPNFQSQVLDAHESNVHGESTDRERNIYLVIFLGIQNQEEQHDRQNVFKVEDGIDQEIPTTNCPLVSVCVELVLIFHLITDHLVQFPAFKLNLLLVELVLDHVWATLVSLYLLFFFVFRVLLGNALAIVIATVLVGLAVLLLVVDKGSVSCGWSVCITDVVLHAAVVLVNFDLVATLPKLLSVGIGLALSSRGVDSGAVTTFEIISTSSSIGRISIGIFIIIIAIISEERTRSRILHFFTLWSQKN